MFNRVEMTNNITILDKNLNTKMFSIAYSDFDLQYIIYLLLPLLFTVTTIFLSIYLYKRKKEDQSAIILIYFLLSLGLCYISASTSSRGNIIGRISKYDNVTGFFSSIYSFFKKLFFKI